MLVIDDTPGLGPALLWSSRLSVVVRAVAVLLATGCTAGVATAAVLIARHRERPRP